MPPLALATIISVNNAINRKPFIHLDYRRWYGLFGLIPIPGGYPFYNVHRFVRSGAGFHPDR